MRVVYSDESGLGSGQEEPITVVAGLMLNIDTQWHPVLELVESALFDYTGEKNPPNYEIKGRELYKKIKNGDTKAEKFMRALMSIPFRCRVPIFYGAIDRAGMKFFLREIFIPTVLRGYDPGYSLGPDNTFQRAFIACLEQVEVYVHTCFPKEQVLWIHDKGRYEEHAKANLKHIRHDINSNSWGELQELLKGSRYPTESHIIDTIYFGKSEESRAIQLADVCCSTIARHLRGDTIAAPYYQLLRRLVVNGGTRPEFEDVEKTHVQALAKVARKKQDQPKG